MAACDRLFLCIDDVGHLIFLNNFSDLEVRCCEGEMQSIERKAWRMSFKSNMGGMRALGRKVVLPADRIKKVMMEKLFDKYPIDGVIDFGAGTLYWSDWFHELMEKKDGKVYPVDIIFKEKRPDTKLKCYAYMDDLPDQIGAGVFFICDVIHHLSKEEWNLLRQKAVSKCDYIVIKDINCNYKFKNWMNKMHDRVINGEKIRDVDPDELKEDLRRQGYRCIYQNLHKLWYSHFLIIAVKKGRADGAEKNHSYT